MNVRMNISKEWGFSAKKYVPERFVELREEVLALSETLVKVKDKKFDGCGFCGEEVWNWVWVGYHVSGMFLRGRVWAQSFEGIGCGRMGRALFVT